MADAPKTGGGGWTALEIIVVLILAIGLLDHLTGRSITPFSTSSRPTSEQPANAIFDPSSPYCGLTIVSPKSNTNISTSISLVGSVSGCNWIPSGTVAISAQVVDANGTPLSDYLSIPITRANASATNFASVIALAAQSATQTGYLILSPATPTERNISVRIPLTFVR